MNLFGKFLSKSLVIDQIIHPYWGLIVIYLLRGLEDLGCVTLIHFMSFHPSLVRRCLLCYKSYVRTKLLTLIT